MLVESYGNRATVQWVRDRCVPMEAKVIRQDRELAGPAIRGCN